MVEKSEMPAYPLKEVLEVKKRRVEAAEKVVAEKMKLLEIENQKLKERERDRDKVKTHYKAKLLQMDEEFAHGTTSNKIDQIKVYIKVVQEQLKSEEKKVKDQQGQVSVAEKNVEAAKTQLKLRKKEQEKITTHEKEWTKETKKEVDREEERKEDEIGSTMFLSKFTQDKARKKREEE